MYGNNAPGVPLRAGGVPVSGVYYFRASSLVPGGEMGCRAGAGGVSIGRFGWVDPAGTVLNERAYPGQRGGVVVYQGGDWRRVFYDETSRSWKIREGMNMTLLSGAPGIWVVLENGGSWGQRIYADPVDGRLLAGDTGGLEPTPWYVGKPMGYGGLSLITTWNKS